MEEKKKPISRMGSESIELELTDKVMNKIYFFCGRFPSNEWSGALFYVKLPNEGETTRLKAVDIYLEDVGLPGHTQFVEQPGLVKYMVDHELTDCYKGLIHSHNSMRAFFSGEDCNTLIEEGSECNHFLSLIVCNSGPYVARLTSLFELHRDATLSEKRYGWNGTLSKRSIKKKVSDDCIVVQTDIVTIKDGTDLNEELSNRIKEIQDSKSRELSPFYRNNPYRKDGVNDYGYSYGHPYGHSVEGEEYGGYGENDCGGYDEDDCIDGPMVTEVNVPKQGVIDFGNSCKESGAIKTTKRKDHAKDDGFILFDDWNDDAIEAMTIWLLTGSPMITALKFKWQTWFSQMEKTYSKKYGSPENFAYYLDEILDYFVSVVADSQIGSLANNKSSDNAQIICNSLEKKLQELSDQYGTNPYIEEAIYEVGVWIE